MRKSARILAVYQELKRSQAAEQPAARLYLSAAALVALVALFDADDGGPRFELTGEEATDEGCEAIDAVWADGGWQMLAQEYRHCAAAVADRADLVAHGWWPGTMEMEMRA